MLMRVMVLLIGVLGLSACHNDDPLNPDAVGADAQLPTGDGTATVSWEVPTTTTTGTTLKDLAGYRIYYGLSETDLSQAVDAGVGLQSYVIANLGRGTWYFAVRAVTQLGVESDLSQIVYKTIE
jgi:hypothetical protein